MANLGLLTKYYLIRYVMLSTIKTLITILTAQSFIIAIISQVFSLFKKRNPQVNN